MNITLREVASTDAKFLYDSLKDRPAGHNINHTVMPTMEDHQAFIASRPYTYWAIIILDDAAIGNIYLGRDHEIGVDLRLGYLGFGLAWKAIQIVMNLFPRKSYIANVAPANERSQRFFQKHGFKLIQYTYRLDMPEAL